MRGWHAPWSLLKLIVAAESVAGNTRTGTLTRLILRKPFQVGLAAMGGLSTGWRQTATRLHRIAPGRLPRRLAAPFQQEDRRSGEIDRGGRIRGGTDNEQVLREFSDMHNCSCAS